MYARLSVVPSNNTYTGGVPTNIYLGYGPQSATIKTTTSDTGLTYSWSPATNLSCSTCQSPVFTPTCVGTFTFTVTITNAKGCSSTETVTFVVKDVRVPKHSKKVLICHNGKTKEINASAVAGHLKNHDDDYLGKCDDKCKNKRSIFLSAEESETVGIMVYPNPASENLFISLPDFMENAVVTLTDMTGKVLVKNELANRLVELVVDQMAAGIYVVQVQYGDEIFRIKIVIN